MLTPEGIVRLVQSRGDAVPVEKALQQAKPEARPPNADTSEQTSFWHRIRFAFFVSPIHFRLDLSEPNRGGAPVPGMTIPQRMRALRKLSLDQLIEVEKKLRQHRPSDLVTGEDAHGYPTDLSAMTPAWIERLSRRGEQLTKALIAEYAPHLASAAAN